MAEENKKEEVGEGEPPVCCTRHLPSLAVASLHCYLTCLLPRGFVIVAAGGAVYPFYSHSLSYPFFSPMAFQRPLAQTEGLVLINLISDWDHSLPESYFLNTLVFNQPGVHQQFLI